ncbi:MAG: oligosaccharide flippase family protein [Paucibacter sp.]|nr:oligosaccharide flippase family protein [Roseateles sp.]
MSSTRQSLLYSFVDRYLALAISMGSSMVIARLLTPTEIGVFSVTMVLLTYVASVRDMSAGQYLVQEKELTRDRIRAVWAVQLGLGLSLALVILLASHPVAVFYREPRMQSIMLVVALNYAINPFGSLTYAWLMREMQFKSLAVMRALAGIAGAVVSIGMAWRGHGPISLAYGTLASTATNATLAVFMRPSDFPWMPGFKEVGRVLGFGSRLTGSAVLGVISGSAPELMLGKLQTLTDAGFFSRGGGLVAMYQRLFVDAVGSVCVPWFSLQQRQFGSLVTPFLTSVAYVSVFGWSFCFMLILLADPMVHLLYGDQWDRAVNVTRLLAVSSLFSVPATLCHIALMASGGVGKMARIAVANTITTVACASVGAWFSLEAAATGLILSSFLNSARQLRVTTAHIEVTMGQLFRSLSSSLSVALIAALGPLIAILLFGVSPKSALPSLVVGCGGAVLGFLLAIRLLRHPFQQEIDRVWARLRRR